MTELLTAIGEATGFFTWPLEGTNEWIRQQMKRRKRVYDSLYQLKKRGLIREISKDGKKLIQLTKKGELETLFLKAHLKHGATGTWDGKWRLAIFDIPEDTRDKREKLRRLLRQNNFIKLQESVYINPFPLNREAVSYLKESGLIHFIRLARIEELDDDKNLRKKFKLTS